MCHEKLQRISIAEFICMALSKAACTNRKKVVDFSLVKFSVSSH